jgi:hypothetical protein
MPPDSGTQGVSLSASCNPCSGDHIHLDVTPISAVMLVLTAIFWVLTRVERVVDDKERVR